MAVAPAEVHFVQACDGPVFTGHGDAALSCACGNVLIDRYDPSRFLAIGIQCGRCGAVTSTPALAAGTSPPRALAAVDPVATRLVGTEALPQAAAIAGRAEMDRIVALYKPADPPSSVYRIGAELLDSAEASFARLTGRSLPPVAAEGFAGLRDHPLGWAVSHLRARVGRDGWTCWESDAAACAASHVAGFLHFVATWSHHPLFDQMAATAGATGFSLHGLAPFAAAHMLSRQGNRVGFLPQDGRIGAMTVAIGPADAVAVRVETFDRFEHPFGAPWTNDTLRQAVRAHIEAAAARINLRNPGLLFLSPGTALAGFDEALIVAIQDTMRDLGRRNRGLMAVAPVVLRLRPAQRGDEVQFGYGVFPVRNRHYRGEAVLG